MKNQKAIVLWGLTILMTLGAYSAYSDIYKENNIKENAKNLPVFASATSSEMVRPVSAVSAYNAPVEVPNEAVIPSGSMPQSLAIPKIAVNANILPLGVTRTGNLDVPPDLYTVGWYRYGAIPGDMGSAVLDGHVDNGGSTPGVFKNLHSLIAGDIISITDQSGRITQFRVIEMNTYNVGEFPADAIFHAEGEAYLNIITCAGTYHPAARTYDKRLVVTAIKI